MQGRALHRQVLIRAADAGSHVNRSAGNAHLPVSVGLHTLIGFDLVPAGAPRLRALFREEHTNSAGEKVTVPGIFMIGLRAFVDGGEVRIPARLRYRAAGGSVIWFYQLYRWEDELRERVTQDLATAAEKTALPAFEGGPEAGRSGC